MTKESQREELIDEINHKFLGGNCANISREIADFIIDDRKRIVEPLVEYKKVFKSMWEGIKPFISTVIDKTLKNAGADQ